MWLMMCRCTSWHLLMIVVCYWLETDVNVLEWIDGVMAGKMLDLEWNIMWMVVLLD